MLDGETTWFAAVGPAERDAALAASPSFFSFRGRRSNLALEVDLGDASPPPHVAVSDVAAVVFDGLLLDREPLRRALESTAPSDETDAEFVLRGYVALGERVFPLLRGLFGLIVWDGLREEAIVVRDPTGPHAVFFSQDGDRLVVGGSSGALLERARISADIDRLALARWVLDGSLRPPQTFHARIRRLPPGHCITAARGRVSIVRYWHPRDAAPQAEATADEAVDRFEQLLDQAVARCSIGRLGIFLSGGVDSASIAASAAKVARGRSLAPPLALSFAFPDEESEEDAQRAIAAALGLPQRLIPILDRVGPDGLLADALAIARQSWTPSVNPWESPYLRVAAEAASSGVEVILTGEGGNDWLEPERAEAADYLRSLRLLALSRLWDAQRKRRRSALGASRAVLWRNGLRPLIRDTAFAALRHLGDGAARARRRRAGRSLPSWLTPDANLRAALIDDLVESWSGDFGRSYREAAANRRLDGVHVVTPLENRNRISRAARVSLLDPLVDPDLLAFLFGLPAHLLNRGGRYKGLAAESVGRRAGDAAADMLRVGPVESFFGSLIREQAPGALVRLGGLSQLDRLGIVDGDAFSAALKGSRFNTELSYYHVWQALGCEAWLASQTRGVGFEGADGPDNIRSGGLG